jgi:hypothetical protein
MKKILLLLLLTSSLYAQHFKDVDDIFLAAPSGGTSVENDFFAQAIEMEISANNHFKVVSDKNEQPWVITTELTQEKEEDSTLNVVTITLMNRLDGSPMISQELVYEVVPEETYEAMPQVIFNILANIPVTEVDPLVIYEGMTPEEMLAYELRMQEFERMMSEKWKQKWLYTGGQLALSPALYIADGQLLSLNYYVPTLNVFAEGHVLDWLSIELGFSLWYEQDDMVDIKYTGTAIPILLKGVFTPANTFMIEPYVGTNFYFGDHVTSLKNIVAGVQFGGNLHHKGILFFDTRIAYDFEDTDIPVRTQDKYHGVGSTFTRFQFSVGFGYKYGFFNRH